MPIYLTPLTLRAQLRLAHLYAARMSFAPGAPWRSILSRVTAYALAFLAHFYRSRPQ